MFSLSPIKILIIVAVILVVLGPDKLPEVARQIGTAWRSLKTLQAKIETEVREVVPDLPTTADMARFARSPINLLNSLADKVAEPLNLDLSIESEDDIAAVDAQLEEPLHEPVEPVPHASPIAPVVYPVSNDPSLN